MLLIEGESLDELFLTLIVQSRESRVEALGVLRLKHWAFFEL